MWGEMPSAAVPPFPLLPGWQSGTWLSPEPAAWALARALTGLPPHLDLPAGQAPSCWHQQCHRRAGLHLAAESLAWTAISAPQGCSTACQCWQQKRLVVHAADHPGGGQSASGGASEASGVSLSHARQSRPMQERQWRRRRSSQREHGTEQQAGAGGEQEEQQPAGACLACNDCVHQVVAAAAAGQRAHSAAPGQRAQWVGQAPVVMLALPPQGTCGEHGQSAHGKAPSEDHPATREWGGGVVGRAGKGASDQGALGQLAGCLCVLGSAGDVLLCCCHHSMAWRGVAWCTGC